MGKWKTFFDFLSDHIKTVLGGDWGNAEIAKPLNQRHPILRWYDAVCRYQRETILEPGKVHTAPMTGATAAYFGLSYNLYLLAHNVQLKKRLIARLKNRDQFHGAYYETLVAAWFILAGFELTLENESDPTDSHCEFTARNKESGKNYSVEAKSRGPNKDHLDVGNQLAAGLRKTANHQRIVMIDVNVPNDPAQTGDVWVHEVINGLKSREARLTINGQPAPPAFVIVTNHPYHYDLDATSIGLAVIAVGFKIPDFGPAFASLIDAFKSKQKYSDIFKIAKAIQNYRIPSTFDGEVPQFAFGEAERKWNIGDRYDLPDVAANVTGVLTTGTVLETERAAYLVFRLDDGRSIITTAAMTDAELSAYRSHPETFFGARRDVAVRVNTPLELFEHLYAVYQNTPRQRLLEFLQTAPDLADLANLGDEDLLLTYCERIVTATIGNTANPSNVESKAR